jgi:hypothetical protein
MTQVNLERTPYAKHLYYNGVYTYKDTPYDFILSEEVSENDINSRIIIEFDADVIPFDRDKARKEILGLYNPENHEDKN